MSIRHENMIQQLTKRVEELEKVVQQLVMGSEAKTQAQPMPRPAPRNAHGRQKAE